MAKQISALTHTALPQPDVGSTGMTKLEAWLLTKETETYGSYYNGKMSYKLAGSAWETYVAQAMPDLKKQQTSENIFKAVIDLYAENLVPLPDELRGFSNVLVPLLSRGECVVVVDSARTPHFPEHFEMISDGRFTIAAIYTRSLEHMEDYVTFAYSDGRTRMFKKAVPEDMTAATREGYMFSEELAGNELFRFALDDKGFGGSMAALQDRVNHSIIDQTVIAEMYARPFWYLLNVEVPVKNPYLANQPETQVLQEQKDTSMGRLFTTSSDGPFGQLDPPTIADMIVYHDSITDKVSNGSGIPQYYFKPGSGTPPTGVALKVLSKRFNNKIARMREDLEPELERLADLLGVKKTREVKAKATAVAGATESAEDKVTETAIEYEYEFWAEGDDLLQESMDAHGISLATMGYPLEYIAEVVTPGVDLDDYMDDSLGAPVSSVPGQPTDMTAPGQQGLVATQGQVAAYGANPGQRSKAGS